MTRAHDLLTRVEGFDELAAREQTEVLLFIYTRLTGEDAATGTDLEGLRTTLGLAKGRSAQHLGNHSGKGGSFVKRARGYALTASRSSEWATRLEGRPTATQTARTLRAHLATVTDIKLHEYLEEAVLCFEAKHLRACIVMTWCACYYRLREWVFKKHMATMNAQMGKWKKPVVITAIDDFELLSERVVIDTCREAGVLTKSTHKILVALLDQRNSYAHPSGRSISEPVCEAFVQQAIDEVIAAYGK